MVDRDLEVDSMKKPTLIELLAMLIIAAGVGIWLSGALEKNRVASKPAGPIHDVNLLINTGQDILDNHNLHGTDVLIHVLGKDEKRSQTATDKLAYSEKLITEPTVKSTEPPIEPATKSTEPTTKPAVEPTAKSVEPTAKPEDKPPAVVFASPAYNTLAAAADAAKKDGRPLVMLFGSAECAPCQEAKRLEPMLRNIGHYYYVNTNNQPQTAGTYGVVNIPTLVIRTADGTTTKYVGLDKIRNQASFARSVDKEVQIRSSLRLVCLFDQSTRYVLPMIYKLGQLKYNVAVADMSKPENKPYMDRLKITRLPTYIIYKGHEAIEQTEGSITEKELIAWYRRASNSEYSGGRFIFPTSQDFLGDLDRVYMRQRLTSASCGMFGCPMHGGVILDYATLSEKLVVPPSPEKATTGTSDYSTRLFRRVFRSW
jgi:thiol-disulfide isomerase/thioredoxin